ncbi:oxidoreductase [Histoplasma ohiense]|nr:oxidoreductase [Histoplasma ohiense (nom. inval.)]
MAPLQECNPVSEGVSKDDLVIPVIDFQPYLTGSPDDKLAVGISMTNAFKTSGFLYLKNHGIPPSVVKNIFDTSASFFKRPQAEKDGLAWTTPQANRGYTAVGREKVSQSSDKDEIQKMRVTIPDLKESFEIGRDDEAGLPNQWPDKLDDKGEEFTEIMKAFFLTCKELHIKVMSAIAVGLSLPEHFFDEYTGVGDNTLRLLHYPSVPKSVFRDNAGQVRAGEHSDYGSITLLFQDARGGLQVRSPRGTFIDVTPIADTIVINAGDLLARWANDQIKSTLHRVVEPPSREGVDEEDPTVHPARYSVAYFCNPNFDRFIEAIPGTYGGELGEKKYEGINSGEYLVRRLAATY